MTSEIDITDADIAEMEQILSCDFSDGQRREVLRCTASRDIQACPGSGKTTLLVAKLAILAKKWPWRDHGICVLSHKCGATRSRVSANKSFKGLPSLKLPALHWDNSVLRRSIPCIAIFAQQRHRSPCNR
jgi:hypothetical protein